MHDIAANTEAEGFWVHGGLGSGKSHGAALWFLIRCFQNRKSRFSWAVAPTHSKVRDILIPEIQKVLALYWDYQLKRDYEIQITRPPRIRFKHIGHEIHLHSGVRPDLMVGTNISHYWITEVGTVAESIWEKCQTRARDPDAVICQGLGEGTPEGDNWYMQRANYEGYDDTSKWASYRLETADNKALPRNYVDKLRRVYGHDLAKLDAYLLGLFKSFNKSTAYWEFIDSRNISLDVIEPVPELPVTLTLDFNKHPLAWVACQRLQHWDAGAHGYWTRCAVKESSGESRGLFGACAEFIAAFDPKRWGNTPILVDGDASGWAGSHLSDECSYEQVRRYLGPRYREVTIVAPRSNPRIKDRLDIVAKNCVFKTYMVSPNCKRLIESHHKTQLKPGTWELEKPSDDTWSHYADAVGYHLYHETANEDFEELDYQRILGIGKPI